MSPINNNQGKFFEKHTRELTTRRREPIQKLPQPPQLIAQQANTKTFPSHKARTKSKGQNDLTQIQATVIPRRGSKISLADKTSKIAPSAQSKFFVNDIKNSNHQRGRNSKSKGLINYQNLITTIHSIR